MRKLLWPMLALLSLAGLPGTALSGVMTLYSIDQRFQQSKLYTIDPTNGATLTTIPLVLGNVPGYLIRHGNGLTTNPLTQELYAVLTIQLITNVNVFTRHLAKIDLATGIATSIGNLDKNFAGIAFASDGTLYGITGSQAPAETLFTINPNTAATTQVASLFINGGSGEMLAYNPDNDLLYHGSGNGNSKFESVDRTTIARTNIPLSVDIYTEGTALTYAGGGLFFVADNSVPDTSGQFVSVTTAGTTTFLGAMDHISKGLAFVESADGDASQAPEPGSLALLGLSLAAGALARRKKRR